MKLYSLGFVKDVENFYKTIDVFLLSSLWEGFGYVMVEAMAEKKPVIAFDIKSSGEVVDDGVSGSGAKGNVQMMAERVIELSKDKKMRESMGLAGYQRVENLFTIQHTVNQVQEFLG